MFGNYGSGTSISSTGVIPSSSAPEISDEEMAYQLQLEALAESSHYYSVPQFQASSSSQPASSLSENRVVRKFGGRSPRPYPGALSSGFSTRQRQCYNKFHGFEPSENTGSSVGREPILELECGICTETRPHTSFMSTPGCNHEYCSDCCKRHAEVKVSSGSSQIQCPHHDCRHNFDIIQYRELLSQPSFDILTTRQTEAAIPSSQKVYCPFQDCSAFMEKPANKSRGSQFVECGTCHRGFCLHCNTPWHANKTCAEYRADVKNANQSGDEKLRDLARKEKWQICTKCQRVISLKDGCYHMTCLCGHEFCYTCGAKWKNKVATCKCKLWDESNIIRARPGRRPHQVRANANRNADPFPNANLNANPFVTANANPFANANLHVNPLVPANANPFADSSLFANPNVNPLFRAPLLERRL